MNNEILCIEDHEQTLKILKAMLEDAGFKTDTALTGENGLLMAKKKKYDLFLLDVMLPKMSGWEVFLKLKTKQVHGPKYVFLSAIPVSQERIKELKKSGISGYLTKPVEKKTLISYIKKVLKPIKIKKVKKQ